MYAFATTPVHGLGMTPAEFWASTPREFAAACKVFDRAREFHEHMYAGIMATLHNAHFELKSKQKFTAAMFLPGYKATPAALVADDSWKQVVATQRALQRKITPTEQKQITDGQVQFEERRRRAEQARLRGLPRAEIIAIMEGA